MENIPDEIPSLEELKNPAHVEEVIQDEPLEPSHENITHTEYKKQLGKKISDMSEEEKQKYNALSQKKKREKENVKKKVEEEEAMTKENNDTRNNLYNQLFVLKNKFPENTKNIIIDPEMTLTALEEKKALILQIITSKNADRVVFQSLLLMCRTAERGLNYFEVDALDGFNEEVEGSEDDIIPILKEMIDMGEIDTSFLTPQLRLMVVMSGAAVRTMEKNIAKKKVQILDAPSSHTTESD
tara:strand:+ start:1208 stop:1930 length:723 start_codon:yes stop_codon:yes gene_type:complete